MAVVVALVEKLFVADPGTNANDAVPAGTWKRPLASVLGLKDGVILMIELTENPLVADRPIALDRSGITHGLNNTIIPNLLETLDSVVVLLCLPPLGGC